MEASFWDGKRANGIADTIDVTQYNSVVEVIEQSFKKYAD
jgi:long-chain acyl-CoA synthetase